MSGRGRKATPTISSKRKPAAQRELSSVAALESMTGLLVASTDKPPELVAFDDSEVQQNTSTTLDIETKFPTIIEKTGILPLQLLNFFKDHETTTPGPGKRLVRLMISALDTDDWTTADSLAEIRHHRTQLTIARKLADTAVSEAIRNAQCVSPNIPALAGLLDCLCRSRAKRNTLHWATEATLPAALQVAIAAFVYAPADAYPEFDSVAEQALDVAVLALRLSVDTLVSTGGFGPIIANVAAHVLNVVQHSLNAAPTSVQADYTSQELGDAIAEGLLSHPALARAEVIRAIRSIDKRGLICGSVLDAAATGILCGLTGLDSVDDASSVAIELANDFSIIRGDFKTDEQDGDKPFSPRSPTRPGSSTPLTVEEMTERANSLYAALQGASAFYTGADFVTIAKHLIRIYQQDRALLDPLNTLFRPIEAGVRLGTVPRRRREADRTLVSGM